MNSFRKHFLEVIFLTGIFYSSGYDILSSGKPTKQSSIWECLTPNTCGHLYLSSNAVDRDIKTCNRNRYIGKGHALKNSWWRVDLGDVYSIYSISILFRNYKDHETRQRGRFAGFSLHLLKFEEIVVNSPCYKDGLELPPLNFSTTCIGFGRYVLFYNERVDGDDGNNNGDEYLEGYEHTSVTELCEVTVKGCKNTGFYGRNCSIPCPYNCKDKICNIVNGSCFGCIDGWEGNTCKSRCQEGWFGPQCKHQCSGHCKDKTACNHATGACDNGCAAGWMGAHCDKDCREGTYGSGCVYNCSNQCINDEFCNKKTGHCDRGCKPGYTNEFCNKICPSHYFGDLCSGTCSKNCFNDQICNHIDGVCKGGCKDGYIGERCNKRCEEGYFGKNCSNVCSEKCINFCRFTDGFCECTSGWEGMNCSKECHQSFGINCQYPCSEQCVNGTCDRFNGSCLAGCKGKAFGKKCDQGVGSAFQLNIDPTSDTHIAGGVVGAFTIVIITVIVVIQFIRYKRRLSKASTKGQGNINTTPVSTVELENRESYISSNDVGLITESKDITNETAKRICPANKAVPVNNLQATVTAMCATDDAEFKNEYQGIQKGELHPCEEANRPENKSKNRYKTTFPYDHSRVVLKTSSPSEGDYINANYIEDVQGKRAYIATQGPKPKTIADFWKMIWQEDVFIIVCLTNLKEGAKNKCTQYWPNINDKLQSGGFNIRNMEEKVYANYTKRRFKVYKHLEQKDREVVMFHYTRWPDHGVPDPLSLVVFHRHVMRISSKYPEKYIAVHCSAGIGRTGTYIALDALYREGEINGCVNVPMYVRTMRKDRMNMIQGDEQYKTVYLVLYESFVGKSRCMTTEEILQGREDTSCYTNCGDVTSNPLYSDFKELLSLRKTYTDNDYESGRTNIAANYTKDVLPVEEFMCRLTYTKGRSTTYYNAVFLQSYKELDSLISAQYPLHDYTEDFLRLVKDMNFRVVVFLCPLSDLESSSLWFPSKNMEKTIGRFTIKLTSSEDSTYVSKTNILIKPKGCSSMRVTVLGCEKWKEGHSIADKRDLVDIVKAAKSENFDHGNRLLILSSDGATRCGVFCVVYNALEQLSMDQEVDIFTITRQLQIRRPEFMSTLEEYQLCHEAVAEYLRNDSVYANC